MKKNKMSKQDVGRPSQLDDEQFFLKIRELILDGNTYEQVQEILEIPKGTWNHWYYNNTHNFQDVLMTYVQERKLNKAEIKIETLIDSEDERVALQASTFIAETLGKKTYSKRVEQTGADGKDLPVPIIQINRDGILPDLGNE